VNDKSGANKLYPAVLEYSAVLLVLAPLFLNKLLLSAFYDITSIRSLLDI
jgi:hypothetical protein